MIRIAFSLVCTVLIVSSVARAAENPHFAQKWDYIRASINDDASVDKLIDQLKRSKEVGCTYVALQCGGMGRLDHLTKPDYIARAAKVRAAADELHLNLVPMIFSIGYGGDTLAYDGNLMSGLPVKDEPFIVKGKTAEPDPAAVPEIKNGGFEISTDNRLADWQQSGAGTVTTIDSTEKHSGNASLKITVGGDIKVKRAEDGRVLQKIAVKPFQYYRLSCWLKTADFKVSNNLLQVDGHNGQQHLTQWNLGLSKSQKASKDWVKFDVVVNTLDNSEVSLAVGNQYGNPGTIWIDDVHFEPAGLLLALHRDTVPLVVTSEDGKTTYAEGKDYKAVIDPIIQDFPNTGDLDITHAAPVLELTDNSSIKDGQKLLISFYAPQQIDSDQNVVTMQDPRVLDIWDKSMAEIVKVWPAPAYFLSGYDEIRLEGWEPNPNGEALTCGQILSRHINASYKIIKKYAPNAAVYTWQDMFSPFHNADPKKADYFLCKGNYIDSIEGVPTDIIMMNWFAPKQEGVKFFADRGFHQVLCGYYDVHGTAALKKNIKQWMEVSAGLPNIDGIMYTTWYDNRKEMKEFFQLVDTYPWTDPVPEATPAK